MSGFVSARRPTEGKEEATEIIVCQMIRRVAPELSGPRLKADQPYEAIRGKFPATFAGPLDL
jgi:hypothetical protein